MFIRFRIKLLLFLYKITKSEKIYNKLSETIDQQTQQLQYSVTKSRWEKIELQDQLNQLKQ